MQQEKHVHKLMFCTNIRDKLSNDHVLNTINTKKHQFILKRNKQTKKLD